MAQGMALIKVPMSGRGSRPLNIQSNQVSMTPIIVPLTHNSGVTHSASAHCREGDRFESQLDTGS